MLKNNENSATINCEGAKCTYETSSASTSLISSVAIQGSVGFLQEFTFDGSSFESGEAELYIANIKATKVTVVSAIQVKA